MKDSTNILARIFNHYAFFIFFVITFLYAMVMPDWNTVWSDLWTIVTSPSLLTHDFFQVGGLAATFVNVSLHFLVGFLLVTLTNDGPLKGVQVAAVGFYSGHAFFGSHILNIIPPILGVVLYSLFAKQPFKQNATLAVFSNTLGPIVSIIWTKGDFSLASIIFGILVGIFIGFISVPLAGQTAKFHQGMTLLNYGYVAGLIGIVFVNLMQLFGHPVEPVSFLHPGANLYISIYLLIVAGIFFYIAYLNQDQVKNNYKDLIRSEGVSGTDFLAEYGPYTTSFNMGVMTLLILLIVLFTGFGMNGTTIGAMFSLIAFSAFGAHPRNVLPTIFGVIIAALLSGTALASQTTVLPLVFSFGLAPFSGKYGYLAGILAGFAHFAFLPKALTMHMGSILYNNGFSTGFIAIFLYPLFENVFKKPKRVKQKI